MGETVSMMSIVRDTPKTQQAPKNVHIVNDMLKEDRGLTIRHISETIYIHHATTVYRIVSHDLCMKKVAACWVHRMLMDKQKQNRVDLCIDLLCRLQAQPHILLHRIITQDGMWVHRFDPKTKRQSMV